MSKFISRLRVFFKEFKKNNCEGASGVLRIEGKRPGPVLGITACTHGNEPAGLAIFKYLLEDFSLRENLDRGTVYLIVNNIKATERFFVAKSKEQKRRARQCDINMNRLPVDTMEQQSPRAYEIKRAQNLLKIWQRFEYGMDVHSTTDNDPPMIISKGGRFDAELMHGFPIKTLITNIDKVQIGKPAFYFYGERNQRVPCYAIEAGQHEEPETFKRAATCAESLLQNLGMISGKSRVSVRSYREYFVIGSLVFKNKNPDFIKKFKTFQLMKEGSVLAVDRKTGKHYLAPYDGHLLFPTQRRDEEKVITEEIAFYTRPMKIRRIR